VIPTVNANCVLGLIECPAGRGSRRERARVQGEDDRHTHRRQRGSCRTELVAFAAAVGEAGNAFAAKLAVRRIIVLRWPSRWRASILTESARLRRTAHQSTNGVSVLVSAIATIRLTGLNCRHRGLLDGGRSWPPATMWVVSPITRSLTYSRQASVRWWGLNGTSAPGSAPTTSRFRIAPTCRGAVRNALNQGKRATSSPQ
jgi:hypothetical protein